MTRKAILIIDTIRGFLNEETKEGKCNLFLGEDAIKIVPNINKVIASLDRDDLIIHLNDNHPEHDAEFEVWPIHCIRGTEETYIADGFEYGSMPPLLLHKTRYSGFFKTTLRDILVANNVHELIIAGVCTEICILATTFDARMLDYNVTIYRDTVYPLNEIDGDNVLSLLGSTFSVDIKSKV